jgi:hypothetical protein
MAPHNPPRARTSKQCSLGDYAVPRFRAPAAAAVATKASAATSLSAPPPQPAAGKRKGDDAPAGVGVDAAANAQKVSATGTSGATGPPGTSPAHPVALASEIIFPPGVFILSTRINDTRPGESRRVASLARRAITAPGRWHAGTAGTSVGGARCMFDRARVHAARNGGHTFAFVFHTFTGSARLTLPVPPLPFPASDSTARTTTPLDHSSFMGDANYSLSSRGSKYFTHHF